jgi:apolipoprotein N-acyltransferase
LACALTRQTKQRLHRFIAATSSGVLYGLSFFGIDHAYLAWICLVPLLFALDDERSSLLVSSGLGWWMGIVTFLTSCAWLIPTFADFGQLPLPAAILLFVAFCVAQGSLFALYGGLIHLMRTHAKLQVWIAAPAVLVVSEWVWPAAPYPPYLGNSQYAQLQLAQIYAVTGPLGMSFIVALASSATYALWQRKQVTTLLVLLGVLLMADLAYGHYALGHIDDLTQRAKKPVRIGIVQGNLGAHQKIEDPEEGVRRHQQQSADIAEQVDLLIWAESAVFYGIPEAAQNVTTYLGPQTKPILFGAMRAKADPSGGLTPAFYNAAFLAGSSGNILGTYEKTQLLLFAERIPFAEVLPFMVPQGPRYAAGLKTDPLVLDGLRYGTSICYEAVLPSYHRALMTHLPHVLVNLTNDAWFGVSGEPKLHLALSRLRAIEARRFMVRAANTGISAIIDPAGRVVAATNIFERTNLIGSVVPLEERTLYVLIGDWPAWLCATWLLVQIVNRRRRAVM